VDPEIGSDLLDRYAAIAVMGDPHDIITELTGLRPRHSDILPASPTRASHLSCHLFVQQTLSSRTNRDV
jgi:hypothetical protein